jgi:hypothetical protein
VAGEHAIGHAALAPVAVTALAAARHLRRALALQPIEALQ